MSVMHSMGTIGEALIPSSAAFILVSHQYLSVKLDEINHVRQAEFRAAASSENRQT